MENVVEGGSEVFHIRELHPSDRPDALESLGISLVDMNRVIQEDGYYVAEILVLEERRATPPLVVPDRDSEPQEVVA